MQQETIKISKLKSNTGQIPGLPKNPRTGKTSGDEQLRQSIIDSPEMLEFRSLVVFPFEGNFVTIMGNRRLKICRGLDFKELPCFVLPPETTIEKLKEYAIKDNAHSQSFDWGMLNADWNVGDLNSWGVWETEPAKATTSVQFEATNPKPIILTVEFDDEASRETLFERLKNEGFNCWIGKKEPKN